MDLVEQTTEYMQKEIFFKTKEISDTSAEYNLGFAAIFCVDCGERIPEARRKAIPSCCRCTECQTKIEETR